MALPSLPVGSHCDAEYYHLFHGGVSLAMSAGLMGGAAGRSADAGNIHTIPQAAHFHSKGFVHHGRHCCPAFLCIILRIVGGASPVDCANSV